MKRRSLMGLALSAAAAAVSAVSAVSAAASAALGPPPPPPQPSPRARMLVTTGWLADRLGGSRSSGSDNILVVHVAQNREHYAAGHIPGALFLGWSEITAMRDGVPNELPPVSELQKAFARLGLDNNRRIVLYGDSAGLSAARAWFTLDYLGHGDRAAMLDGGLEKWKAEGREVSTAAAPPAPLPGSFRLRLRPDAVVALDVVRDISWSAAHAPGAGGVTLIDARPPDEYRGEKPGEGVTRPGHIPGASNLFWMQHVVSRENPVLRPLPELAKMYRDAGAAPGRKVITYCRTGGQAAHAYFIARYLGYDVAMYDGSFFEWNRAVDTPVVTGSAPK